jgi:POT family proton-dependent oligopeptide transporter
MGIGSLLGITGFVALAVGARLAGDTGKVNIGWLIAFHTLNSISFANVFPVALALYARAAPAALSATIIGVFYLHLFAANNIVGWLGGKLESMSPETFWYIHAALCGSAGVIFLISGRLFGHLLAPTNADVDLPQVRTDPMAT